MSFKHHKQMSVIFPDCCLFVSVRRITGRLYLYFRGKVFANAQTGNIVLLSQSIIDKDLVRAIHYLVPLLFFALGIAIAECIHVKFQRIQQSIGANWFSYLRFFFCWLLDFCRHD